MSRQLCEYIWIFVVFGLIASCEQAEILLKKGQAAQNTLGEFTATPGESAFRYLSRTYKDQAVNVAAILEAMNVAHVEKGKANLRLGSSLLEEEELAEVSEDGLDIMEASQLPKTEFVDDDYLEISDDFLAPDGVETYVLATEEPVDHSTDTVDWTYAKDDFTISSLAALPVRDQGRRGTCAAHAAVAQMEAYLIKKYGLSGIDLSEQRFYYMSKPDTWTTGGDPTKEGSNGGTGFAKSNGFKYEEKTYPPGSPTDYNLPLETDCPYNPEKGATDTQYPQAKGCETGVAKVIDFRAWLYKYKERVSTAQQIFDMLVEKDIPVIVATKLSENWENNDGIITLADSGGTGATTHASGHAYVVVGAKKLNEAKYPGEGGMCFYIRNSWGRGWGIDGLSCMTLAWFNTWRYASDFDQVNDLDLDTSKFAEAKKSLDSKPTAAKDADGSVGIQKKEASKRRGTVNFLTNNLLEDERKIGALVDDENKFWKVLYAVDTDKITLFGILDGETSLTQGLELKIEGNVLKDEFENKGTIKVGEIDQTTGIITLCAVKYAQVCKLNYLEEFKQLVVGLTENEFQKQDSQAPYNWRALGIPGYAVEFSLPGKGTSVDIRFSSNNQTTNPLRFLIDPLSGQVNYQGQTIGSITEAAFCSGPYAGLCRVVKAGEKFAVLFRANKK